VYFSVENLIEYYSLKPEGDLNRKPIKQITDQRQTISIDLLLAEILT